MNNIVIRNESDLAYTQVANLFIDEYMPQANGSYVKVYLLILRMLSDSKTDISVSEIADILWLTENDVIRSFKYWQKTGLLDIRFNSDGTIREPVSYTHLDVYKRQIIHSKIIPHAVHSIIPAVLNHPS